MKRKEYKKLLKACLITLFWLSFCNIIIAGLVLPLWAKIIVSGVCGGFTGYYVTKKYL